MRTSSSLLLVSSLVVGATALAQPGAAPGSGSAAPAPGSAAGSAAGSAIDPSSVKPEDMPTAVRMRRLEQKTQALKERAWQLKARVQLLKEQLIGGGVGAQALIAHVNEMGSSFRLIKLVYTLDGTQVFVRTDETAEDLYKTKAFDVFAGPIAPGNHTLAVAATYRGHGYGVFEYLSKYTFTARGSSSFIAGEGKLSKVDCRGFEKGGATTPLENRPAVDCKVTQASPDKPNEAPAPTPTAATTPGK
ncbi:MAG: dihydrolipoamide acetyltransferase [Kofleriaceae bacterium]